MCLLSESLQFCAVPSCFLSLDGLLIYFHSALFQSSPLSLPAYALSLLATARYSNKCAGRKVTLAKLPGWNPGLIEEDGKIPVDFNMAKVSPFSFEAFSASESQHFCKLCFAPGSLIASEIRAERMVSQGQWPGKEFLGCQVLR